MAQTRDGQGALGAQLEGLEVLSLVELERRVRERRQEDVGGLLNDPQSQATC